MLLVQDRGAVRELLWSAHWQGSLSDKLQTCIRLSWTAFWIEIQNPQVKWDLLTTCAHACSLAPDPGARDGAAAGLYVYLRNGGIDVG